MGSLSIWHWIIVIAVVLLLFGRGKISELMGDVAQGIKAFKKGMSEDEVAKTEGKTVSRFSSVSVTDDHYDKATAGVSVTNSGNTYSITVSPARVVCPTATSGWTPSGR